jgi:VWFA-related protein
MQEPNPQLRKDRDDCVRWRGVGLGRIAVAALLLLAAQPLTSGQVGLADEEAISVSIVSIDDTAFPEVTMVLTADQQGRPIADIQPQELQIEESGSPATPVAIQRAVDRNMPLALVVTLDVSGSMQGSTLDSATASAVALVNSLASTDWAAVLAFADEVRVEQPLTQDKAALVDAVSRLGAGGNTALYDAVAESAALAAASGVARRAVVLLSDGEEFGSRSRLSREGSLAAVSEAASLFYVVGVGPNVDQAYLEELAARSGSRFFRVTSASEIPAVYASLQELLRSQYVVTFHASSLASPQDRSVKVLLTKGASTGSAERPYRSLRPPASSPSLPFPVLQPAPAAAPPEPTGGSFPVVALAAPVCIVAALLGLGGAWWFLRRKATHQAAPRKRALARTAYEAPDAPSRAVVVVASGPTQSHRFELGERPVTIGSGRRCVIRLPAAPGLAEQHARMWWRDGRLMLHHIAPGHVTTLAGKSVVWAAVEDRDEVSVGPYVLRCLTPQGKAGSQAVAGARS